MASNSPETTIARAINRVLAAEREAADAIAAAQREAEAVIEAARTERRRLLERARSRATRIHGAAQFALKALLAAQFPNGAWPQGFEEPPDPAAFPVAKASYPSGWSRTPAGGQYWKHYTLNDNVLADMAETLLDAAAIYGDDRYRDAAKRTWLGSNAHAFAASRYDWSAIIPRLESIFTGA